MRPVEIKKEPRTPPQRRLPPPLPSKKTTREHNEFTFYDSEEETDTNILTKQEKFVQEPQNPESGCSDDDDENYDASTIPDDPDVKTIASLIKSMSMRAQIPPTNAKPGGASQRTTRGRTMTTVPGLAKHVVEPVSHPEIPIKTIEELQAEKSVKGAAITVKRPRNSKTPAVINQLPFGGLDITTFLNEIKPGEEKTKQKFANPNHTQPNEFGFAPKTAHPASSAHPPTSSSSQAPPPQARMTPEELSIRTGALLRGKDNMPKSVAHLSISQILPYITDCVSKVKEFANYEEVEADNRKVEECPRAHAELMMVQAHGSRRKCRAGKKGCECSINFMFVMCEYLSPKQWKAYNERKVFPDTVHGHCYICLLSMVFQMFIDNAGRLDQRYCKTIALPFRHIVSVPGEYDPIAMINPHASDIPNIDTHPDIPLPKLPRATAESTFGLTLPFRKFSVSQFHLETIKVHDDHGVEISVQSLREEHAIIFSKFPQSLSTPKAVAPFTTTMLKCTYIPSTVDIIAHFFSQDNTDHNIGARRIKNHGKVGKAKLIPGTLPHMWCSTIGFPWYLIFVEDLSTTEKDENLRQLIDIARVDVPSLLAMGAEDNLCIPTPEPRQFSDALSLEDYKEFTYYIAMSIRYRMLITLKAIYPNSKNTARDSTVHVRLRAYIEWFFNGYYQYMHVHGNDRVYARSNEEVDMHQLEVLSKVPVPYHQYSFDYHLFKFERVYYHRLTPREFLLQNLPEEYAYYRPYLCEFDKLHECMAISFATTGSYFENVDNPTEDRLASLTRFKFLKSRIENPLEKRGYSVYIAALVRVNAALSIHAQSRHRVEQLRYEVEQASKISDIHDEQGVRAAEKRVLLLSRQLKNLRTYRYNLRLFAFTHIRLIQLLYDRQAFTNSSLFEPVVHPNPNYALNYYEQVRPYDTFTAHQGMLPDFSSWIDCVPFPNVALSDNQTTPITHTFMRMMHFFMQRTSCSRLQFSHHARLCAENPSYNKFISLVLEVSLLGAYEHADYCPRFDHCVTINRLFSRSHNTPRFKTWQENYASIVFLALREFAVFQVKLCPPYQKYLVHTHPWWTSHCKQVYAAMDIVRLACTRNHKLSNIQIAVQCILCNDQSGLRFVPRDLVQLFSTRYPEMFKDVTSMPTRFEPVVDYLYYLCKHLAVANAALANLNAKRIKLPRQIIKSIEDFVRALPRHLPLDVEWLLVFNYGMDMEDPRANICPTTLLLLRYALYFIKRGQFRRVEDALLLIGRKDYEFVDAFFSNLLTHFSINVHPLCTEIAEQQALAVARRNHTENLKTVSPWIVSMAWAPCCGIPKSYVAQDVTAHTLGEESVGLNVTSGKVVCKRKEQFSSQKRTSKHFMRVVKQLQNCLEHGNDGQLTRICQAIQESSKITPADTTRKRYVAQSECTDTPLVPIPMLGQVVEITSPKILRTLNIDPITNAFALCTQCGAVSLFSTRMFGPNGFVCGECSVPHIKAFYTPDCSALNHDKIKLNTQIHHYSVIDDRPDGDQTRKLVFVCDHCFKIKTAGFEKFHGELQYATDLQCCRYFERNHLEFALTYARGEDINHLFGPESSYFTKLCAANNKRRRTG